MFVPAPFGLFEFDDSAVSRNATRVFRWLPSWQGPAQQPAEEVCLGWLNQGNQQAVVSTARVCRHPSEHDRRYNAVFLVLGGQQLRRQGHQDDDPASTHRALERLSRAGYHWTTRDVELDGFPVAAYMVELDDHTFAGYITVSEYLVCFATVAIRPAMMRLRRLTTSAAATYAVNPTRPIDDNTLQELRQSSHWQSFRPDGHH